MGMSTGSQQSLSSLTVPAPDRFDPAEGGARNTTVDGQRHLDVAVGDAEQVAVLHCHQQLLEQPAGIRLWHAALLHKRDSMQIETS